MRSVPLARAAALLAGIVFVTANTAPVVCAAAHHSQHAAEHGAGHHDHEHTPDHRVGATVQGSHATPPGCADVSHCEVAVNGVATAVAVLRVAAPHALAEPLAAGQSPHTATFSPPTPPPRA